MDFNALDDARNFGAVINRYKAAYQRSGDQIERDRDPSADRHLASCDRHAVAAGRCHHHLRLPNAALFA